jgi:hypothetical protein
MADERIVAAVKIADPTTTSQVMGVDASGHAQVDIAAASATVTVDSELAAAAALSDAFANPTTAPVGAFLMGFDGTDWERVRVSNTGILHVEHQGAIDTELPAAAALADNVANPTAPAVGAFGMLWDGATWDRLPGNAADGVTVNLGSNNDVTITGSVDTELPVAAALADAAANPTVPAVGGYLVGFNGTTWDRVRTANTGRLQVDVITGGGSDSPTNPTVDHANSTDTAAGSSANLDSAEITEAEKLWEVIVGASVAWKAVIQKVENGSATAIATLFGQAGTSKPWKPVHRDLAAQAGASAGLDVFRAVVTNLDTSEAADLYADFFYAT